MVYVWIKNISLLRTLCSLKVVSFQLIALFMLVACKPEINVDLLNKKKLLNPNKPTLIFPISELEILAGDSIIIPPSNGLGPYNTDPLNIGSFDLSTMTFSAPDSTPNQSLDLTMTDANGLSGQLPIKIIGLKEKFLLDQPLSYGDQNYPMSVAQTADGSIYVNSVVIDGSGWEYLATFKSTNNGSSWSMVDRYYMYIYGEAHPMEMTTKGNDIYVCGYVWGIGNTDSTANSEWIVRKSTNAGSTWQIVDHSWLSINDNVCSTITTAVNGHIFAAGYSSNASFIRDTIVKISIDDGNSWQIIGTFPSGDIPTSIRTTPNGDVWVVSKNKLYKGTYTLGAWNWSAPITINASTFSNVAYQKSGQLTIVDDNTAYFTGRVSSMWKIYKTTDSGLTWSQVHSSAGEGVSIIILSTGEIISNGNQNISWSEGYNQIFKSTDNGATFNQTLNKGSLNDSQEGGYLLELLNGEIIAIGTREYDDQMVVLKSNNKGNSWNEESIIYYFDRLYTEVEDYAEDSLGNIFTTGWIGPTNEGNRAEPYVVMKSTNNGLSWTRSDFIFENNVNHFSSEVEVNPINNYIFATEYSYSTLQINLRMSSDSGNSWQTIDTTNSSSTPNNLAISKAGKVFYLSDLELRRGNADGTGFNTIFTFPVNALHTNFKAKTLLPLDNGDLIFGANITDTAITYGVIYKSTDQGASWSEIYRAPAGQWDRLNFIQAKNSTVYMAFKNNIFISTDFGQTWSEFYNSTTVGFGSPSSMATSNDSTLFFSNGDDIYFYSSSSSSWRPFWKIETAITPIINSSIRTLFHCRFSKIGICANVIDYTKGQGSANYLWAAE